MFISDLENVYLCMVVCIADGLPREVVFLLGVCTGPEKPSIIPGPSKLMGRPELRNAQRKR